MLISTHRADQSTLEHTVWVVSPPESGRFYHQKQYVQICTYYIFLQFPRLYYVGQMLGDDAPMTVKQGRYCLLRTPYRLIGIHHFNVFLQTQARRAEIAGCLKGIAAGGRPQNLSSGRFCPAVI